MDGMNRRAFLRASSGGAAAAMLVPLSALASTTGATVLFDARFPTARKHAEELAGGRETHAIAGDATELMHVFASGDGPRQLMGVTTESVPFCLSELAPHANRPQLTLHRLDQDLFAWHLEYKS